MIHLYRPGEDRPVCGAKTVRGEPTLGVRFRDLCSVCLSWRAWRCQQLQQEGP